jgi:hypothetical protein
MRLGYKRYLFNCTCRTCGDASVATALLSTHAPRVLSSSWSRREPIWWSPPFYENCPVFLDEKGAQVVRPRNVFLCGGSRTCLESKPRHCHAPELFVSHELMQPPRLYQHLPETHWIRTTTGGWCLQLASGVDRRTGSDESWVVWCKVMPVSVASAEFGGWRRVFGILIMREEMEEICIEMAGGQKERL